MVDGTSYYLLVRHRPSRWRGFSWTYTYLYVPKSLGSNSSMMSIVYSSACSFILESLFADALRAIICESVSSFA